MKKRNRKSERGTALIMALLALMVLSAIAVGLVYMTNTETLVNSNYRAEQVSYFAAKAGMEEARDRMMLNLPGGYYFANMAPNPLPTAAPADSNQGVLYLINEGNQPGSVQPWAATVGGQPNPYMDDEICHDGYTLTGVPTAANAPDPSIHCTSGQLPTGANWYASTTSQLPYNGTAAALPFKWVRVAMKLNGSVQNYQVNPGTLAAPIAASTPVCWNGVTEVVLNAANCGAMTPAATPVYTLTALAVSPTPGTTSGARKLVQAEVALNPSSSFNYGLFGTGTGCDDVKIGGGGYTDSFDGSKGSYGASLPGGGTNKSNTGGDVGSNGNVDLVGNGSIGGSLGVLPINGSIAEGPCNTSNYTISGANAGLVSDPSNVVTPLLQKVQFPTPPQPVPAPPTTSVQYTSTTNLVPGTYGNLSLSGKATLILAPGVYNINSLSMAGQSSIQITPLGQVVLNIAGNGVSGNVLSLSGNSVDNKTLNANQFQINYGGNGSIQVTGNASTSYFVLNSPNAAIKIAGNGAIFGAIVGATIDDQGGAAFHYDKSVKLAPPSTGALQLISFRHIPY